MSQGRKIHHLGERIDGVNKWEDEKSDNLHRPSRSSGKQHHYTASNSSSRRSSQRRRKTESGREPLPKLNLPNKEVDKPRSHRRLNYRQAVSEPTPNLESPNNEITNCKKRLERLRTILNAPDTQIPAYDREIWLNQVDRIFLKIIQKKSANISAEIGLLEAVVNSDEHKQTLGREKGRETLRDMLTIANPNNIPLTNIVTNSTLSPAEEFQKKSVKPGFFRRVCCGASNIEKPTLDKQKNRAHGNN